MNVKELLNKRERWTRGAFARDIEGIRCEPEDQKAQSFCLYGALQKCYPIFEERRILLIEVRALINGSIIEWNDDVTRTYEDVISICERLGL